MQVRTGVEAGGCVVHIVAPDSIAITVTMSVATDPTADPHHGTDSEVVETDPVVIFERPALDRAARNSNDAALVDYAPAVMNRRPNAGVAPDPSPSKPTGPPSPADATNYTRRRVDKRRTARHPKMAATLPLGVIAVLAAAIALHTTPHRPAQPQLSATTTNPAVAALCSLNPWLAVDSTLGHPFIPTNC